MGRQSVSDVSEDDRKEMNIKKMSKQNSVPLSVLTTQKHSSFQDNNLLVPSSIQEDEVEETLRSASPNLQMRSNQSRLAEWRTQKNISLDEYNEISEHCSDYDQVQAIDEYVDSINRAMSENNVRPFTEKRGSKFRKFYHSNLEDELSVSDDAVSLDLDLEKEEVEEPRTSREAHRLTLNENNAPLEHLSSPSSSPKVDSSDLPAPVKSHKRRSKFTLNQKFSTNQTNSHVDIETVDGKVSF